MMRLALAVSAVMTLISPTLSHATEGTKHPSSHRSCFAKIGDEPSRKCAQLLYMQNFPIGGESITAKTDHGDVTFSGRKVDSNIISVAGVYVGRPLKGKGKCKLTFSAVGRLLKADCTVHTELGLATLKSTGDDPNDVDLALDRPIHN